MSKRWTVSDIPDLRGKRVVVTGANSGLGFEAAYVFAAKGAQVTLAVRNLDKGQAAAARVRAAAPAAQVEVMPLDLADLGSVRRFAVEYRARIPTLNVLLNNAGVMWLPYRRTTEGFEMHFGANHLGHFALTGLLLPALLATPGARVVTVSSLNHLVGRIEFDNLDAARRYNRFDAYAQAKLANLLFAYELERRFEQARSSAISVACHPGYAATNLQTAGARIEGKRVREAALKLANRLFAQSARSGALPLLYAATAPDVRGGDYIGPGRLLGTRGHPVRVRSHPRAHDLEVARRLWEVSEQMTGVHYEF